MCASLRRRISAFEKLFNVAIPKPYDLRADLARRKKNYSVLLPKLKETFEKNIADLPERQKALTV
jgi:hypothetical protein